MAEKGKNSERKNVSLDDLLKYKRGALSDVERHALEKRMLEDDFEREAMEGYENLESVEIQKDTSALKKQISERTAAKKSIALYWRIAASLLFIISASFVIYFLLQTNIQESELSSQEVGKQRPDSTMIAQEYEIPAEEEALIPPPSKGQTIEKSEPGKQTENVVIQQPEVKMDTEFAEEHVLDNVSIEAENVEEAIQEEAQPVPVQTQIARAEDAEDKISDLSATDMDLSGLESADDEEIATIKSRSGKSKTKRAKENARVAVVPSMVAPTAADVLLLSDNTYMGIVVSEADGTPIPGINVILKGTTIGAITDIDGQFSLELGQSTESIFVVSGVGYLSRELTGEQMEGGEIQLSEDITSLSEVVVVGYGANKGPEPQHVSPKPVGGHSAFKEYIQDNIRYPETKKEEAGKTVVRMSVLISKAGKIGSIKVLKSPGELFEKEAIRLMKEGPDWEPAREDGNTVEEAVTIRIRFKSPKE